MQRGLGEAAPSRGGFPHERLHQDKVVDNYQFPITHYQKFRDYLGW
ncbi:MAG: hypothetical protein F6J98_12660 [Moorea sp. SIO4G2]|nr:hypothetical protein [Moorena bouillonii]NEO61241.1 hypothetical protein [Moorena sp. SIO4G2]